MPFAYFISSCRFRLGLVLIVKFTDPFQVPKQIGKETWLFRLSGGGKNPRKGDSNGVSVWELEVE